MKMQKTPVLLLAFLLSFLASGIATAGSKSTKVDEQMRISAYKDGWFSQENWSLYASVRPEGTDLWEPPPPPTAMQQGWDSYRDSWGKGSTSWQKGKQIPSDAEISQIVKDLDKH